MTVVGTLKYSNGHIIYLKLRTIDYLTQLATLTEYLNYLE